MSILGIILIILAIVVFLRVTAFAVRAGMGVLLLIGIVLIVLPLMGTTGGV